MSLSALTAGVRVNKDKNATALALQTQGSSSKSSSGSISAALPPSLDFFGTASSSAHAPNDEPASSSSAAKSLKKKGKAKRKEGGTGVHLATKEESEQVRREHKIKVQGEPCPLCTDFSQLGLPDELAQTMARHGWTTPTAIQMQAVPLILEQRDVLACAHTGSGKTLAFLLPLLLRHLSNPWQTRSLRAIIVEPTRELARQVYAQAQKLSQGLDWKPVLLGETPMPEDGSQPDLCITTPLRLIAAIKDKSLDTTAVESLCFDEADKLFELDFLSQSDDILTACTNPQLRKAMFSATVPSGFEELVRRIVGVDLVRVIVGHKDSASANISQHLRFCANEEGKIATLRDIIANGGFVPPVLIFVQSVERAQELEKQLQQVGVQACSIHSNRTKAQRDRAVAQFSAGEIWCLVSTEVMARGVDFKGINMVINYDLPSSPVEYLHRIGRTGRNGRSGKAVTFFTSADAPLIKPIVNVMKNSSVDVPEYLSKIKNLSKKQKKTLKRKPVERKGINEAAAQGYAAPTVTGKKRKRDESGKGASSKGSKGKGGKKKPTPEDDD